MPAIVRWPGRVPEGSVCDQTCITFDFTASIAKAARVTPRPDRPFDGMDIIGHVVQSKPSFKRTLFWRKPRGNTIWMGVRDGNMKYVAVARNTGNSSTDRRVGRRSDRAIKEYVFDLSVDPSERNDLKEVVPETLARLRQLYKAWEADVRSWSRPER